MEGWIIRDFQKGLTAMSMSKHERLLSQIRLMKHLRDEYAITLPYEQILCSNYMKFLTPESVVFDIGANVGEHLENFLKIAWPNGYILAFEPIKPLAMQLEKKFASKSQVFRLHDVALSDYVGESDFIYAEGTPGESGLRERRFNHPDLARPKKIRVLVRRLDEYTKELSRVDYIKIDIEGGEIDCIKGGLETIERFRPIISAEYGQATYEPYGYQRKDLWEFAQSIGYTCLDIFGNIIETLEEWNSVCDQVYWDFYIVPDEKVEFFKSKIRGSV